MGFFLKLQGTFKQRRPFLKQLQPLKQLVPYSMQLETPSQQQQANFMQPLLFFM